MRCYSVSMRLAHKFFGGSAIWIGAALCGPLAASEGELRPAPVQAPDVLTAPSLPCGQSGLPAASLEETCGWYDDQCDYGYAYEDEYGYYHDEYQGDAEGWSESERVAEEAVEETLAEESWADQYDYQYDYDDHYDYYDYAHEAPSDRNATESEADLDLFAWQPAELLDEADCDLLRSIEADSKEPSTLRRTRLNDYIESLGFAAIDFAYRYEDATDADVLALADDLPGVAVLLACYRLIEQGQVEMDAAVVLLQQSLSGLSLDWIEQVGCISAGNEEVVSHPVVDAMAAAATYSLRGAAAMLGAVSQQISELPWCELAGRVEEIRSAFRPLRAGRLTF